MVGAKLFHLRSLVLISEPEMEAALLDFIRDNKETIVRFPLSVFAHMAAKIRELLGPEVSIVHEIVSKEMGADSAIATHMVLEDVGCIINLRNPFAIHPWACDTGSLVRLINVGNVLHASNPTTAISLIASFEIALKAKQKLPLSFYKTLESPSVALYQKGQDAVIASCVQANGVPIPASNRLQPDAATGNLADPQKIVRQASPALSRGNLLATSFPLKEDAKSERDIFVKETLSTQSKDVLVGWAKGAKEAVATEHAVSKMVSKRMRCLALISHNNMKPAMQKFVKDHTNVLRCFRLTGTASTMKMLRSVMGEGIEYGPTCASGPLGGDAQVGTQMVLQDLGGIIFFTDPLTAHPHAEDIATLLRMADMNNVMHATNPITAVALVPVLRAVAEGETKLIPSFFHTMSCPRQTSESQSFKSRSVGFKDVKSRYSRNSRASVLLGDEDTVSSDPEGRFSAKQIKALIKMQAFSRGKSTRNNLRGSWSSSADDSSRFDGPAQMSFSKNYVDKLKAELSSKTEDNEKLRRAASLPTTEKARTRVSEPSTPPASGKVRTGSRVMGLFRRTG